MFFRNVLLNYLLFNFVFDTIVVAINDVVILQQINIEI